MRDAAEADKLPFPREVLIDAARLKARGAEWETIAEKTGADVADLVTFSIDHPEVWGPLYARAEKLRLQEAEGETIKGLCALLKGDDEEASEAAAKELLIHRRHVERRRYSPQSTRRTQGERSTLGAAPPGARGEAILLPELRQDGDIPPVRHGCRKPSFGEAPRNGMPWLTDDPPPEEIVRRITYATNRVAHGDDYFSIAKETGRPEVEVTRWAFIYAKAWDKAYPTARRAAAQAGAALAVNRLLDFVVGPDLKQAARAGRLLLVHRRYMHWANQPQSTQREAQRIELSSRVDAPDWPEPLAADNLLSPPWTSVSSVSSVVKPRDGPG